ncbi:MAG TPA: hypothetical protein V6D17_01090, partial [Candidatus Obscuribacterales bacterium]
MRRPIEDFQEVKTDSVYANLRLNDEAYKLLEPDAQTYRLHAESSTANLQLPELTLMAANPDIPTLPSERNARGQFVDRLLHEIERWEGHPLWMQKYITDKFGVRRFQGGEKGCAGAVSFLINKADTENRFEEICSPLVSELVAQMKEAQWSFVPPGQERPGDAIVAKGKKHIGLYVGDGL